jgi:hypothetical protein
LGIQDKKVVIELKIQKISEAQEKQKPKDGQAMISNSSLFILFFLSIALQTLGLQT